MKDADVYYQSEIIDHEEGHNIFEDNYEPERLIFYSDHHIVQPCIKDEYENYLLWLIFINIV